MQLDKIYFHMVGGSIIVVADFFLNLGQDLHCLTFQKKYTLVLEMEGVLFMDLLKHQSSTEIC